MAQATGIHISANRITAVFLKGSSKSPRVVSAGWMARPPADEMSLGKSIRALLADHSIPRDPAVATVANDDALMRAVAMPFTRYEEIKKVLKGEAEAALPGISVDEVVLTSHFLGAADAEGQVLTIAMRKERMREILDALQEGGIDPVGVTLEGFSLAEAVIALDRAPEAGTVVAVDADPDCLRVTVIKDRRVRVVRTVRLPLVTETAEESHEIAFNSGVLGELQDELTRTLVAGGVMDPPQSVLLGGPLSGQEAMAGALEKVFGVSPERFVPDGMADASDSPFDMPGGNAAFGAALQGLGADATGVNLRIDEFGFKRTFDQVAGALAALVTVIFIAGLLCFVDFQQQYKESWGSWNKRTLSPAYKRFGVTWRKVQPNGKEYTKDMKRLENVAVVPRTKLMGEMIKLLQREHKRLAEGPIKAEFDIRSSLDVWKAFSDQLSQFRPNSKYWVLDHLDITTRDVTVKGWFGTAGGRGDLDVIVNLLKRHELFVAAQAGSTQVKKGPDGKERLEFSVTCRLPEEKLKKSKKTN